MRKHPIPDYRALPLTREDRRDLRSNHAGEHGAVAIYRGMLAVTQDPGLTRFARRHLLAESRHLKFFRRFLPADGKSRLLPIWWLAGWLLGAGSALSGPRAAYTTIAAVERFVEDHYNRQIMSMRGRTGLDELVAILRRFCADEIHHRDDALASIPAGDSWLARTWGLVVDSGSRVGVAIARRI